MASIVNLKSSSIQHDVQPGSYNLSIITEKKSEGRNVQVVSETYRFLSIVLEMQ